MSAPPPRVPPSVAGLAPFVAAGVFGAGEVQVAAAVARLCPDVHPDVLLATAVAARAPALGHVGIELDAVAIRLHDRLDRPVAELPWPDVGPWAAALAASPAVAAPHHHLVEPLAPLVWDGRRVYLQRYWCYEVEVAEEVAARAARPLADGAPAGAELAAALDAVFPPVAGGPPDRQRQAAALGLTAHLSVIAGGPGTGKTRTVARLLAAALRVGREQGRPVEVALAAPTGKAAARMTEAVHQAVAEARADGVLDDALAEDLLAARATTIHALLGWAPGTRFRHDRIDPLPHDLVVVDETSMVSLPLMARLLAAVRPDARVVLVGDPHQLASVDAGTVLADLVGPGPAEAPSAAAGPAAPVPGRAAPRRRRPPADAGPEAPRLFPVEALDRPAIAVPVAAAGPGPAAPVAGTASVPSPGGGGAPTAAADPTARPLVGRLTVLDRAYRFGARSAIAELADAVRQGRADDVLALLDGPEPDVGWVRPDDRVGSDATTEAVTAAAVEVVAAARAGDADAALAAAHRVKVLAAVRHGDGGLRWWSDAVEWGVARALPEADLSRRWYVGRPVLVTANDPINRLSNGDVGVVLAAAAAGGVVVAIPEGPDVRTLPVSRLQEAETWWAMTIHKSQGSEFPHVVVSLPDARSPILTRELLYTAVTRARERVTVLASEEALRVAIARPVARASGLGARLWPAAP